MRRSVVCVAALAAACIAPAGALAARAHGPSAAKVQRAVARAERSPYLWATVNVCTRSGHGGVIGVRGEMPALPIGSSLTMTVALQRFSPSQKRFVPLPGATATRTIALGHFAGQVHQGGAEFPFATAAGRLSASVTFSWARGGAVVGQVTRATTGGHPQAAFGRPAHHSAAECRLG